MSGKMSDIRQLSDRIMINVIHRVVGVNLWDYLLRMKLLKNGNYEILAISNFNDILLIQYFPTNK
ncbi:MAG TPA: hypothetical protein ENK85_05260 [Saprospiraceae bacterium]|nr:hypothetical protein [Saprospiraceae bacterium]